MRIKSMTYHLLRRNGIWYYRRKVPKPQRSTFGDLIQVSLETRDQKLAIRQRELLDVEWSRRFETAPCAADCTTGRADDAFAVLTEDRARRLVQDYVSRRDEVRRRHLDRQPHRSSEGLAEHIDNLALDLAVADGTATSYDHIGEVSRAAKMILKREPVLINEQVYSREAFFRLVRRALIEISRRALACATDDHTKSFFDEMFDPAQPRAITVGELSEQFLEYETEDAQAHGLSEKHLDKTRASLSLVREMLGDATLIRDVDFARCRAVCSLLARVPANRTKLYPNVRLLEAIERAEAEARPTLSAITQQQYLATLKGLLDLAVNLDALRTNPAANMRPLVREKLAARDKRLPFQPEQLRAFFASKFYQLCADRDPTRPYRQAERDWRFWLPLISLLMGMRPREICQLHLTDIRQTEGGTWFLSVEPTEDDEADEKLKKSTKTRASRRAIPLHPELEKLGFLLFAEDQRRASSDPLLFRGLKRNKYGDPAAYPLRFLREQMAKDVALKPRQAFYSFRHTWRDAVREVNPPRDFVQAVGAWEGDTTTSDHYGSLEHVDRYARYMGMIEFNGVEFSHLHIDVRSHM